MKKPTMATTPRRATIACSTNGNTLWRFTSSTVHRAHESTDGIATGWHRFRIEGLIVRTANGAHETRPPPAQRGLDLRPSPICRGSHQLLVHHLSARSLIIGSVTRAFRVWRVTRIPASTIGHGLKNHCSDNFTCAPPRSSSGAGSLSRCRRNLNPTCPSSD